MNAIVDLSAEATAYINLLQDLTKSRIELHLSHRHAEPLKIKLTKDECSPCLERIGEIVWSSKGETDPGKLGDWLSKLASDLLNWLRQNIGESVGDFFAPAFTWREHIRHRLYEDKTARLALAKAIRYMPLQVIQAVTPLNTDPRHIRLYQVLETEQADSLLSTEDKHLSAKFWEEHGDQAQKYLEDAKLLREKLLAEGYALPFETLFDGELDEICRLRTMRGSPDLSNDKLDPYQRAEDMDLAGLALSGGGIRSATFNLGILQRLANLGVLRDFDYLSTVSGGGYIGTWFTNWVRQVGSIDKVSERLCPVTSPVPHAEEVRPIRWLRMFSNYLAPNASLMSADAWTIGTTWLRNTLINQVILLLLLVTVLSGIDLAFSGWLEIDKTKIQATVWACSLGIFGVAAFLAGSGMRSYDRTQSPQSYHNGAHSTSAAVCLVIWSFLSACCVTTWCYTLNKPNVADYLDILWPCIPTAAISMIAVSGYGRYHRCRPTDMKTIPFYLLTIVFSLIAAAALWFLLACCGAFEFWMKHCGNSALHNLFKKNFEDKLVAICCPVVFLEAGCVAVVVRMALLGNLFPDERREWWGRLGALVHRQLLIWVLVCTCSLLVPKLFSSIIPHYKLWNYLPGVCGGWAAIVGFGVKFAFSSGDAASEAKASKIKTAIIAIAPYLFMLGFLLIGASVLSVFLGSARQICWLNDHSLYCGAALTLLVGLVTLGFSYRVGVNEFSLHHFYRNRLIRAYLGAARRRTDRERTANSFTGFDSKDDFSLASLSDVKKRYDGPYPLINAALNASAVTDLDRQDRKAESFIFSPLYCGFDFSPVRSAAYSRDNIFDYAYRPTDQFSKKGGPSAGTAMAISGAAVNPNQGFHSNTATAFLLTLFNVRLGWWLGNPRGENWQRADPRTGIAYLVKDMIGRSDISSDYVAISDGGHFDNMGLYELVRRRCSYIVLCDAEEDHAALCSGLANAIRRCYIDFGVVIDLDINPILNKDPLTGYAARHTVTGTIKYPGTGTVDGTIVYIKASLTVETAADIREYAKNNPSFPHQSTGDQFFDEAQFESYRKLGYRSIASLDDLALVAPEAADATSSKKTFSHHRLQVSPLSNGEKPVITLTGHCGTQSGDQIYVQVVAPEGQILFAGEWKGTFEKRFRLKPDSYQMLITGFSRESAYISISGPVETSTEPIFDGKGKIMKTVLFDVIEPD